MGGENARSKKTQIYQKLILNFGKLNYDPLCFESIMLIMLKTGEKYCY